MSWETIILAIVQGLTEWLPVSSSGHLAIAHRVLGVAPDLAFDIVLHFGTLMAVFVYFGKDITDIAEAIMRGQWKSEKARLGFLVLIATIPAGIVGYFMYDIVERAFSNLLMVALGFAITGCVLFIASLDFTSSKTFGFKGAFLVGCAQAVAIFPGISRSGSTIASGLLLGLNEKDALRFSFLMSIPVIFGANILAIGGKTLPPSYLFPCAIAFLVGLATIHLLFRYVLTRKQNLRWFGVYALVLAVVVGLWAMFGQS